jgi:hypothetical protein
MENVVVVIGAGQIGQRVGVGKHVVPRRAQRGQRGRGSRGHGQRWLPSQRRDRRCVLARGGACAVGTATGIGEIVGLIHAAGVSPSLASPDTILHVDLYGTAVVLEEFGKVMARRLVWRDHLVAVWPSPAPAHHRAEQGISDDAQRKNCSSCHSSNSIM